MVPSYQHMQLVLLDKHTSVYQRGDVIAFSSKTLDCVLVKRIAAVPGDSVVVRDKTLMVNGLVSDIYPLRGSVAYAGRLMQEIQLGPKQYLVLGDNLAESIDSRYLQVGLVDQDSILGKICPKP